MIGYLLIACGLCLVLLGWWMISNDKNIEVETQTPSTKQQLDMSNVIPSVAIPVLSDATKEEEKKGTEFESHIVDLFRIKQHSNYRELLEWQGDKYSHGVYPESNCNPDLVVRIGIGGGESRILGVECKWRNAFVNETLKWARPEQIERYMQFGKDRSASVFVALGVGGSESHPDELFIVPINLMADSVVHRSALLPFKQKYVDGYLYYDELRNNLRVIQDTSS